MMRLVFALSVALSAVLVLSIESNFYYSELCANITGSCVLESECPHSVPRAHKDLCPDQKKAVCCTNFPAEDLNCFQLHNACLDQCPDQLNRGRKGCPNGQTCCVLI